MTNLGCGNRGKQAMTNNNGSFEVGIEFESVLRAISKQIYETPHAFIRENVQNAIDAVRIQALRDDADPANPEYRIAISVEGKTVSVYDNGIGMSRENLKNFFWTIGSSGKRGVEAQAAGCVGMFGIGGFANFGVCEVLQVTSQDQNSKIGTTTELSAEVIKVAGASIPLVKLADSNDVAPRGTLVIGRLFNPTDSEKLKIYLKSFVQYVPIRIEYNEENISQRVFEQLEEQENLTPVSDGVVEWRSGDLVIVGELWVDRGHTLVAAIREMHRKGERIEIAGRVRFEGGALDVFKRGFKLCATQLPSTIGVSGRMGCDLFMPTAGRDSLDPGTSGLLAEITALLEAVAVDAVLESPERIAQYTRIFRYISRNGLVHKMDNVVVRMADGTENTLGDVKRRASTGRVSVFFGTAQNHALNQVMQAQGHIVVLLSSDRYRRAAEQNYLKQYCHAQPFDGVIECSEVYENLELFERIFLSEVEQNVSRAYEIKNFSLIGGKLTENIPALVRERTGKQTLEIFVDIKHAEVTKLKELGANALLYSLISIFCREYIGPSLKKWSPRFFGDGAINLELFSRRRSDLWVLVKEDIGVVRRGGHRQVVTSKDVAVINVTDQGSPTVNREEPKHRLLLIIDEESVTDFAGYYIRLPGWAFDAYGDLLAGCDSHGVVWIGNKMTFVGSDEVSAQFQYEIRLDEIVAVDVGGRSRAEGALELDRPLQEMFGSIYFPIPKALEAFLVPKDSEEIRLDLHCEWIDMRTRKLWEAEKPAA